MRLIKLTCLLLLAFLFSCTKHTNRQNQIFIYGYEGTIFMVYLNVENSKTGQTMWVATESDNLYNELCENGMTEDEFRQFMCNQVESKKTYMVSDSLFQLLIPYGKVDICPEIEEYYNHYGIDSLLKKYDINKFNFFEFNKLEYVGLLLWQNDITINMGDEDQYWYVVRNN